MKKRGVALGLIFTLALSACQGTEGSKDTVTVDEPAISISAESESAAAATEEETAAAAELASGELLNLSFETRFNTAYAAYEPLEYEANAPAYSIEADLSNVVNMDQYPNLTQAQRDKIAGNGFVVIPTDSEQIFYIYEDNAYKNIPSFVTVDSVLQVYHVFFDYSLRTIETNYLLDDLKTLNSNMLNELITEYNSTDNELVKEEVLNTIGYFAVSGLCLGSVLPADFPQEILPAVQAEYDLILAAEGELEKSPLLGSKIDYSLFTVRGHYTRSDELGDFFRAMSWYGVAPMPFYDANGARDESSAMKAIISTIALCRLAEEQGVELWNNIYNITSFYVGEADDISPADLAEIITEVYSEQPNIEEIYGRLDEFYAPLDSLPAPLINSKTEGATTGLQFRFMGQRYIPDSEILQNLSEPYVRPFPTGVDVFGVFGSERAEELLDEIYQPTVLWPEYQEEYDKLSDKFRNLTVSDWTQNVYYTWLYTLNSFTGTYGEGYPLFMQNQAWQDKSLSTALGSWAELRHDTILYGKQSGAECGGGDEPPQLKGYVEPNPETFNRLLWLTQCTKENLHAKGYLDNMMEYKLETFEEMLTFLRDCALKELRGEDLSVEENYTLLTYGGTLEHITASIAEADNWYLVESDTDKNMAVIADVHTVQAQYLEAAVGHAAEIYVVISQGGELYLTRGAVFDYFEFVSDQRLTDEEWQTQIKESVPERPPFTNSYMDEESAGSVPVPDMPYTTGC